MRSAIIEAVRLARTSSISADDIAAHLSTAPSGQAPLEGVKPLEWQLLVDGGNQGRTEYFEAQTILGYYTAYERYGNVWFETPTRNDFNATRASTIEAAKAAAQADYEARIRSALLPASAEPVAWVDPHTSGSHWPYVCKQQTSAHTVPLYASPPASGAVEAGWQLVPEQPTMAMCNAAVDHTGAGSDMSWSNMSPQSLFRRAWFAMLAAAPTEGR